MSDWESINVPKGGWKYYSFGSNAGQEFIGRVTAIDLVGGLDYKKQPCPIVDFELESATTSVKRDGSKTDLEAGDNIRLTASAYSLKQAVLAAKLNVGDTAKVLLTGTTQTANGTAKDFDVAVKRGTAPVSSAISTHVIGGPTQAELNAFGEPLQAKPPF